MGKFYLNIIVLFICLCSITYGQSLNYLSSLADTGKVYNFQSVQTAPVAQWQKISSPNFGKNHGNGWVKFQVYNPINQIIWLEAQSHFIDTLSLMVCSEKNERVLLQHQTPNSRFQPLPHQYFLFQVPLKAQTNYTFYMKGQVLKPETLKFPVVIWTPSRFYQYIQRQTWNWAIFIGIMLMAIIISMISFGFHHRPIYVYYAGYILFTSIYALLNDGWGRYLPNALSFLDDSVNIGHWLNLGLLFLVLFSHQFLNIKVSSQKWLLKFNPVWLSLFIGLTICAIYYAKITKQANLYEWLYRIGFVGSLGYLILWVSYIWDAFQRKFRPVWLHVLSIVIMLIFYFINLVLINTGILKLAFPDMPVFRIALMADVFFIIISLIYRNWLHEKTQKNLQAETQIQQQELYMAQKQRHQDEIKSLLLQNELQLQRERLARDLHDGIGSQLTHIASKLDVLAIRSDQARQLAALSDFARETNQILRETIWVLNHNHIEYTQFQQRMSGFLSRLWEEREQPELKISMTENSTLLISPIVAMTIFRIGQEVINNALKYANADCIEILFGQRTDRIVVEMGDNGNGFDPLSVTRGYGLNNIQKRCSELGGKLILHSASNGTVVIVELPPSELKSA